MTTLYLFSETPNFPGEVFFNGCFDQQCVIKRAFGLSEMIPMLEAVRQQASATSRLAQDYHIVLLLVPLEKIQTYVLQFKSILPHVVCIAVVDTKDVKDTYLNEWDCLFLERPLQESHARIIVAAARKKAALLQKLYQAQDVDEQSHLFSQRYFMSRLENELALTRRHKDHLSCVLFGVRFYNMYQDCYGFSFIEKLFAHIAEIFKEHIRQEDVLAKLGDDEIGLLLPRSPQDGAIILATRIIEHVASKSFQYHTETEQIELCCGVYGYQPEEEDTVEGPLTMDADQVIRYSRHALHHAKKSDDNSVYIFNQLYPLS